MKQTLEEWRAEAIKRFGKDPQKWAFVCPACGRVSTIGEFTALGKDPNQAYQECIGRVNGHMRPASEAAKEDGDGCDWCAFGLFGNLGKGRTVVAEDGHEVSVFDFAPTPPKEIEITISYKKEEE